MFQNPLKKIDKVTIEFQIYKISSTKIKRIPKF